MTANELSRDPDLRVVIKACLAKFESVQGLPATADAVLEYVDTARGKLKAQSAVGDGILVVYGASGSDLCAGLVRGASRNLIVDQTLYAASVASENEALFLVGMLNSPQINEAIAPFQAAGLQTERHVHKLPFIFVPRFDAAKPEHMAVVAATKQLMKEFESGKGALGEDLSPSRALAARRRRVRTFVEALPSYPDYWNACDDVLERVAEG
jgi:hypothetical protein